MEKVNLRYTEFQMRKILLESKIEYLFVKFCSMLWEIHNKRELKNFSIIYDLEDQDLIYTYEKDSKEKFHFDPIKFINDQDHIDYLKVRWCLSEVKNFELMKIKDHIK